MDYIAKMLDHLTKAEEAHAKIALWEKWARDRIPEADTLNPEELLHRIGQELEHKLVYRKRINNRDYHARMAQTYGIAAMALHQVPHGAIGNLFRTMGQ